MSRRRRGVTAIGAVALVGVLGWAAWMAARPVPLYYFMGLVAAYQTVEPYATRNCGPYATFVDGSFRLYRLRRLPSGFIVFYTYECARAGQPPDTGQGYYEFQTQGLGWSPGGSRGHGPTEPAAPGASVTYRINGSASSGSMGGYTYVAGQVITSATSVAVRFGNGGVLHDSTTGGRFAIVVSVPVRACALELRDAWGQVVYSEDLSHSAQPAQAGTCQP